MNDDGKLNLLPFLSDISLLVVIFFIAVIIAQQLTIKKSEKPFPIQTDTFFESKEYTLDSLNYLSLKNTISKAIFDTSILPNFNSGKLVMLRIEGHTDKKIPTYEQGRAWQTNRELSLHRANTVSNIFSEIAELRMTVGELKSFNSILFPGGKGEYSPLDLSIKNKNGNYIVAQSDTTILNTFPNRGQAQDFIDSKNRRIDIYQVLK